MKRGKYPRVKFEEHDGIRYMIVYSPDVRHLFPKLDNMLKEAEKQRNNVKQGIVAQSIFQGKCDAFREVQAMLKPEEAKR